jgi:SNF2 family DNA or RNA helicase
MTPQIVDNKAVVFHTRTPANFEIIPKHQVVQRYDDGSCDMAVYWGLDETIVLRNLGMKELPSPITARYEWPSRYKPMGHQKETSAFLTLHKRAFVLSEPGTAKTMSALWAADYLMVRKKVRRCLILCPLSIMQSAWMGDIGKSIIHRTAIVAHHAQATRRIEMIQGDYEFVIMNYDGLPLVANEIKKDGRFDLVIVDEANAFKVATTRRWKMLHSILTPDTRLWMMTGTPAAQSPEDAYGLAKLVNPTGVPNYFSAWRDMVMNKISMFKWAPKADAKQTVHKALQPAIRFTKADCLDLPPVLTTTREVEMTAQQKKYYNLLKERMILQAAGETITAVNAAAGVSKLLQLSSGAAYTDNGEVIEFDVSPRLRVLDEIMDETSRKVLVFAQFRNAIDVIVDHLRKRGISTECIHGDISASQRARNIADFQSSLLTEKDVADKETRDAMNEIRAKTVGPRVLVMQPQASAHGITLTAADTVVFYGPIPSVELYTQCCARADRQGQTADKVTVVHIQSSPIEKRLFAAMDTKVSDHRLLAQMFTQDMLRENA